MSISIDLMCGSPHVLLVAYWLKHWTVDRKVQGVPVPLAAEIYFSSGCTQPGGEVKPSVRGTP